jgi:hypothetical protein
LYRKNIYDMHAVRHRFRSQSDPVVAGCAFGVF